MFSFFRNNSSKFEYPNYWEYYISQFENKIDLNNLILNQEFTVLDVESNGLDPKNDKILSIGAVKVKNNSIELNNVFEIFLEQSEYNPSAAPIHGILKDGSVEKVKEETALKMLLEYLGNSIIVGHSIGFDFEIINETIRKYIPKVKLRNELIDTIVLYKRLKGADFKEGSAVSLDDLSKELNIPQSDRHNAAGDSFITAVLFIKLLARLKKRGVEKVENLLRRKSLFL